MKQDLEGKDQQISILTDKLAVNQSAILTLKLQADRTDQYSRRNSVRLFRVKKEKDETATQCLNMVMDICKDPDMKLNIPGVCIDRAHRVGSSGTGSVPSKIVKFTTWRHRTAFFKKRVEIRKKYGCTMSLDLTKQNLKMIDKIRSEIDLRALDSVEYVFADINCQPTVKMKNDKFLRFNTIEEGIAAIMEATETMNISGD